MRIDNSKNIRALRVGLVIVALGLICAPRLFEFHSDRLAAWSAWTLSALYLAVGTLSARRTTAFPASALLTLGLWTLLAPGILGFDLSNPSAFWTHTVAGLLALWGSYHAFGYIDPGEARTSRERASYRCGKDMVRPRGPENSVLQDLM